VGRARLLFGAGVDLLHGELHRAAERQLDDALGLVDPGIGRGLRVLLVAQIRQVRLAGLGRRPPRQLLGRSLGSGEIRRRAAVRKVAEPQQEQEKGRSSRTRPRRIPRETDLEPLLIGRGSPGTR